MVDRKELQDDQPGRDQPAPRAPDASSMAGDDAHTLPAHVLLVAGYRRRPYFTLAAAEKAVQKAIDHGQPARMYLGRVTWEEKSTPDIDTDGDPNETS